MPLASFFSGSTKRHTLKEGHIVSHFSGLADDDTHAMVNKEPCPDLGRWMNLNPCEPTGKLRDGTGDERHTEGFQPMGNAISQQRVKAGIREDHFHPAGRGRVTVKNRLEVLSNRLQHGGYSAMVRPVQSNKQHGRSYLPPSPLHRALHHF